MSVYPIPVIAQNLTFNYKNENFKTGFAYTVAPLDMLKQHTNFYLHKDEIAHFATLAYEKKQHSYLLGHFVAKSAVAQLVPTMALQQLLIHYGIFRFPLIDVPNHAHLQITYSHSHDACIAIAFPDQYPLGIDLEKIDQNKIRVIKTQLSAEEIDLIDTNNGGSIEELYCLFWTAKEALSKVLRSGMMTPFHVYAIKSLKKEQNYWILEFKNFAQYQAVSFVIGSYICTIVQAIKSEMELDIHALQNQYKTKFA